MEAGTPCWYLPSHRQKMAGRLHQRPEAILHFSWSNSKNICTLWKLDPFGNLFRPLIMSPLLAIVTCCHQVCVPPVVSAQHPVLISAPPPEESAVRDTAGWRLNLGNIKIRELMQIANSFKRFSSHSKDQGVEPGWFAFQWALSKLIWYHLDLWPNETNDRTSWTYYLVKSRA